MKFLPHIMSVLSFLMMGNLAAAPVADGDTPEEGDGGDTRKVLIILAQYSDLSMTYTREDFDKLLNHGPYSARRYFNDQFLGACRFTFDVSPVVTLSHNQEYYGKNDTNGNDRHAAEAVSEACGLANAEGIDFSEYDYDGDGTVDNILLYVAGKDEAEGGGENAIWSHSSKLSKNGISLTLDGKNIDPYAIGAELGRRGKDNYGMATIGTFCHELGHTLGLVDMYNTELKAAERRTGYLWGTTSLMDNGHRNNGSRTPPSFNAIERDCLGIGKPEPLKEGTYTLEPIGENGRYLRHDSDNEGEYYLIECRAVKDWDLYIGGSGLVIYHIDKSGNDAGWSNSYGRNVTAAERWSANEVNCNAEHQCADLIEAYPEATEASQVFYPYGTNNAFDSQSTPAFKFWNGSYSTLAITNIVKEGDNVSFSVVTGKDNFPPKVASAKKDIFQTAAIIQWSTDDAESSRPAILNWGPSGTETKTETVYPYSPGCYAIRLEGLKPSTDYSVRIKYEVNGNTGKESVVEFSTKALYSNVFPFIYLNDVKRNDDGSFNAGSMFPLIVFNASKVQNVEWRIDDETVEPQASGYFPISKSCTLTARITYVDGTMDIIQKEITVK